jgi:deoxyribodipyrimidine photo-lyase
MKFEPTRAAGLQRLQAFLPSAGKTYRDRRNFDLGPRDRENVSCLSPWLRHRLLTESEVVEAVLARHGMQSADAFIREVFWRTYWKGWLELRPSVWERYCESRDRALDALETKPELKADVDAATAGRIGMEGFDDWAKELVGTGYLHNHARMWFASIWIFTLRLPWEIGADFFLRHLMDGDAASNTLSWRWVAGLQTRGKHYLATSDNIERFTGGRFRPKGLATEAQPLTDAPFPEPLPRAAPERPKAEPSFLLITDEDCVPETPLSPGRDVVAAGVLPPPARSPLPIGERAEAFQAGALADAAERNGAAALEGPDIFEQIAASGARQVLTAHATVGPARDRLNRLKAKLDGEGVALVQVRRSWDEAAWPHATKGFFPFKETIPELIRKAGIDR